MDSHVSTVIFFKVVDILKFLEMDARHTLHYQFSATVKVCPAIWHGTPAHSGETLSCA